MNDEVYDTVIIGSGPAGLTAAIYNIRANLKTIVVGGNQPGGQLTITTLVDNYPGFSNGIGGVKLMMDMMEQVKNLGGEIKNGQVKAIKSTPTPAFDKKGRFEVLLEDGGLLHAKAVIVATGSKHRWLGLPGEQELIGKGVSGCATCDGMFFRDKAVAIVGGGDSACTEADFLARFASKVYMIHRRDSLRAAVVEQKLVLENKKIEMVWNSEVVELVAENDKLHSLKIRNNKTGEEKVIDIDGLFVAIGGDPATEFVADLVERKEGGQIVVGKNLELITMSSMSGIFAAGDCVNDKYMQAIIAAGDGARAALDAEKWLKMSEL